MELSLEPDLYAPSVNLDGNFIDRIPAFNNFPHGIRCPCGTRKDKAYTSSSTFSAHIKTKAHTQWLAYLNLNKQNIFVENERNKQIVREQQLLIQQLQNEITTKNLTINHFTKQLYGDTTKDLLDFD
jgi:hypothetical protein